MAEHHVLVVLNHHRLLVSIWEAGETSKPSSCLLGCQGNLLCPSPGAALRGSSTSHLGLNSMGVARVAKDLLAPFLCLLMCESQRPLLESKGPLLRNHNFHCLLFSLEINMSTQPGWWCGRGGLQLHPASLRRVCALRAGAWWDVDGEDG